MAAVAYVSASLVHEGLGHGGACLLVGCRPQRLTTMEFQGDETGVSRAGINLIAAAGTLANLVTAAIVAALRGLLVLFAGPFEPGGALIVLISGVAASLGGTSGLAWGPQLVHDRRLGEPRGQSLGVTRDWRWIVAGAIAAAVFIFVLGHGLALASFFSSTPKR